MTWLFSVFESRSSRGRPATFVKMTAARRVPFALLSLAVLYCAASLIHFVHNAEYLAEYPSMPLWISRSTVYAAWCGITAIGIAGLCVAYTRFAPIGFLLVAIYGAFGFDGLGHYALAPISSHTAVMNFTIWFEVVAAALLVAVALRRFAVEVSRREKIRGG
jgi:hypothetical protein